MRIRIALVAAVAACIVFSVAVASAAATSGRSSIVRAVHARAKDGKATSTVHTLAVRHTFFVSPELARQMEWQLVVKRLSLPAPPPPAPAPPPPAPAPPVVSMPAPAPAPPQPQTLVVTESANDATSTTTPDWACIRDHESDDNYSDNTGNGYSGAYQFMPSTWNESVSGAGYPQYANGEAYEAPPAVQNAAALWLYNRDGWSPWSTRYVCGL